MKIDKKLELNKKFLRKKIINLRDSMSSLEREEKSKVIASKLFNIEKYKKAKFILLFYPFGSEINTRIVIKHSLLLGKKVALPKVIGKNKLEAYLVTDPDKELEHGFLEIMEPDTKKCNKADIKDIELAIIPGVCFDTNFNRLGYGGGFYDHLISSLDKKALKISLCFEAQLIENVPVYNYDKKIDMIITEKRILSNLKD